MSTFILERRIYYHHTDTGGVVYYGNYLRLIEEALVELLRYHGIDTGVYHHTGIRFATVHIEIEYKSPARYGDTVTIYPHITRCGDASVEFRIEIKRDNALLIKAHVIWVCIGPDFKKMALPEDVRKKIAL